MKVRHSAARELGKFRAEMARQAREATAACLEVQNRFLLKMLNLFSSKVYTASQYMVDSAGQRVCVGSISELWERRREVSLLLLFHE